MYLICQVTSHDHFIERTNLWVGAPCDWSIASRDIKYLICHMTSQNHVILGSSNFMSGRSSLHVTTLPSLVAIGIVVVEILVP